MTKILSAEEEFLKAFENIPNNTQQEEYRAYYNEDGWITGFAGSGFPAEGSWVTIDKELYTTHNWDNLRLIDGKIIRQIPVYCYKFPLTRSKKGVKVVKCHANIVVEPHEDYEEVEYYDRRNS